MSRIDGGLGDDRIASTVVADFAYGITKATNRLDGFDGNDRLIARLEMPAPEGEDTPPVSAFNRLDGGAGNDVMNATVTGLGRSIFNGGSGTDVLKVSGGQNNLLSGGSGADRMFAGSGTDRMFGGGAADDFVFDVGADQASDRLFDFDGDLDRLAFIGVTDRGAAGLADDLDAISSIVDQGAGGDVVVSFDSGSVLTFEGAGLGIVDSFGDLVGNARNQLVVEIL